MRGPLPLRSAVVSVLLVTGVVAGCSDDDGGPDPQSRLVDVYATTIEAIVDDADALPPEGEQLTVFVSAREEADLNADVQVGVVNELAEWAMVRFIDDVEEAVDAGDEEQPVRDDGVLIGLGPVSDGDARATLAADRYVGPEETIVYEVALERRGGEWRLAEPLDGVAVRSP